MPGIAGAKTTRCTLRVHAEGNSHDGAPFSTAATSANGQPVILQKVAAITEHDVVSFRTYPANDGSYGAVFVLDNHGRLVLDTLSIENRGSYLHVLLNGRNLAELQIDRRVSDGKLYVASGLTNADIELMKKTWPAKGVKKGNWSDRASFR
ncbi:MAG TPA: hypothetical protein VGC85_11865 [Chthoniobacterales bacterium]